MWNMSTGIGSFVSSLRIAWIISKSGVNIMNIGDRSVTGRRMSSMMDWLLTGIGNAGVMPALDVLSGCFARRVSIHIKLAYKAAASGRYDA